MPQPSASTPPGVAKLLRTYARGAVKKSLHLFCVKSPNSVNRVLPLVQETIDFPEDSWHVAALMLRHRKLRSTGIVAWPEGERPRERLLRQGAQALTDAEIVAILLRVGVRGTSAVELARQILKKFGSLRALAEAPLTALLNVKGLKGAKAAQLAAATEVARRMSLPDSRERVTLKGTRQAADYLRSRLQGLSEEHFRALFLNRRGGLLDDALLAVGTVDQARPSIRVIVTRVLQVNASAVIVGHNHPSGAADPSESDRLFTEDLFKALKPIQVKLLDHIIIGGDVVYSFADDGLMDEIALSG